MPTQAVQRTQLGQQGHAAGEVLGAENQGPNFRTQPISPPGSELCTKFYPLHPQPESCILLLFLATKRDMHKCIYARLAPARFFKQLASSF
jgi:hypothetical protein